MANIKCPNCGGQYCDFKKKVDSYEGSVSFYYCNGCKRDFSLRTKRKKVEGEWLLTFHLDNSVRGTFKFYRDSKGEVFFNELASYYSEMDDGYKTPIFRTHYEKTMLWCSGHQVTFCEQGYRNMVTIDWIELNQELTTKALQNEAMKAVHSSGNSFVINTIRNDELLRDVCQWIRPIIRAKESESARGCYIATCVYGSYDCPSVWTLRRFRDSILASTWYGRIFIHVYYAVSPIIVKYFGHSAWFKKFWRSKLDILVEKLQITGIKDTPYEDVKW